MQRSHELLRRLRQILEILERSRSLPSDEVWQEERLDSVGICMNAVASDRIIDLAAEIEGQAFGSEADEADLLAMRILVDELAVAVRHLKAAVYDTDQRLRDAARGLKQSAKEAQRELERYVARDTYPPAS